MRAQTKRWINIATFGLMCLGILHTKAQADPISPDCTYKGIKLYGKIQVVHSFPDIKIQVVKSFPDLKVKWVNSFPDECGKWQKTENFPDIKIQFVKSFPDVKIEYVESFPGLP